MYIVCIANISSIKGWGVVVSYLTHRKLLLLNWKHTGKSRHMILLNAASSTVVSYKNYLPKYSNWPQYSERYFCFSEVNHLSSQILQPLKKYVIWQIWQHECNIWSISICCAVLRCLIKNDDKLHSENQWL